VAFFKGWKLTLVMLSTIPIPVAIGGAMVSLTGSIIAVTFSLVTGLKALGELVFPDSFCEVRPVANYAHPVSTLRFGLISGSTPE
jgi:hypothetical protein